MLGNLSIANKLHIVVMIALLALLFTSVVFPKTTGVSDNTIKKLDEVVQLIEKVNTNVDTMITEQRKVNNLLLAKYKEREAVNDVAYEDLLKQYGIPEPTTGVIPHEKTPDVIKATGNHRNPPDK